MKRRASVLLVILVFAAEGCGTSDSETSNWETDSGTGGFAGSLDASPWDGSPDGWPDSGTAGSAASAAADSGTGGEAGGTKDCPPCDDGNPCNGVETCDPSTGLCIPGEPIVCDDGDPCNGMETCNPATGACESETFPACPVAPPECGQTGGVGGPTGGQIKAAEAGGFRLYDEDRWSLAEDLIDQIAAHPSVSLVTLGDVLNNLNRTGQRVSNVAGTECFHTGFEWNSGDANVTYWYPQGISGSADAQATGVVHGRSVGMVSWYHKPENEPGITDNKAVRISIFDVTDMNDIRYRLALLVKPVLKGTTPDFEAVKIHAGGIVWYKDYLYVADTSRGFRVFDLTRILQVKTGETSWFGKVSEGEGYHAYNYRYVIPEVTRYHLCASSCCARFSFVGLDRSTTPHSLLSGEYSAPSLAGRLHRWFLDESTGKLELMGGRVQATEAVFPGVENMQGAVSRDGQYFVSCSGNYLGLHTGKVGQAIVKRGWPYGPEDLHYAPSSDNLWSLTEHPGSRSVFAVKRAKMEVGCN